MIKTEFYTTRPDGVKLYLTYSDSGFYIKQNTGAIYSEAIDVENSGNTYAETTTPIPAEPQLDDITALQLAVTELAESQIADQTANELALAELAEIVLGG